MNESSEVARSLVVIGGGSGIGAEVVRKAVANGYRVQVIDRDIDAARRTTMLLGESATAWAADVMDEATLAEVHAQIEAGHPPIVGLVNCAGARPVRKRIEDYPTDEWEANLVSHLRSTYVACRVFGSAMARRGAGSIVNFASVLAFRPGPVLDYGPAKAGVASLTESLAVHWACRGVRVNAVAPGWTDTPFLRPPAGQPPRDFSAIVSAVPIGRLLQPAEVADVVHYLLSPSAGAVTGVVVPCDGGYLAGTGWLPYGGVPQEQDDGPSRSGPGE